LSDEPFHEVEFTVGLQANFNRDGTIKSVKGSNLWQDMPNFVNSDTRLLRVKIEIPESFFAVTASVKGRIESRLEKDFEALMEVLEE